MTVYVDAAIHRWRGQLWCHVFSPDIEELHRLMASIGSKREWFQDPSRMRGVAWPHYDANAARRAAAVAAGAVELNRHQTVVMAKVISNLWFGRDDDPLGRHRARNSHRLPQLDQWLREEMPRLDRADGRKVSGFG